MGNRSIVFALVVAALVVPIGIMTVPDLLDLDRDTFGIEERCTWAMISFGGMALAAVIHAVVFTRLPRPGRRPPPLDGGTDRP